MLNIDWGAMAAPWQRSESGLELTHQTVLDGLMRCARLEAGQRVLDIGCGTGANLLAAATAVGKSGEVTGVDIAPPLVARAKERVLDIFGDSVDCIGVYIPQPRKSPGTDEGL